MQTKKPSTKPSNKRSATINLLLGVLLCAGPVYRFLFQSSHLSRLTIGVLILQALFGLLLLFIGLSALGGISTLGNISHEQVFDVRIEERVRKRYAAEIQQLTFLGFNYAFTEGESFSLYRVVLIYPAVVLLMMLKSREVLTLQRSGKIVIALPIFRSADGRTFGHPFGLGVKFQTAFRNGLILTTKNFGDECCETSGFVMQAANRSVAETWQAHQNWLSKLETGSNPANRDSSYQAYADISRREGELMKSLK